MSLFRKQPQTAAPPNPMDAQPAQAAPSPPPPAVQPSTERLFNGSSVDMSAIYRSSKLTSDELDRVSRAEGLLHLLPSKSSSNTREIVDATFHAFGVNRASIVDAASKQLDALERFIRSSQEHTQGVLDIGAKRIAELEAEIERHRHAAAQATHEGEERARTLNTEMVKVQRVLDFFGGDSESSARELDEATGVNKHSVDLPSNVKPPVPKLGQRPIS